MPCCNRQDSSADQQFSVIILMNVLRSCVCYAAIQAKIKFLSHIKFLVSTLLTAGCTPFELILKCLMNKHAC